MFGIGIWELIIIYIISFFSIGGYVIYKNLRGATAEEIEMAKRINREKEKEGQIK